MNPRNVNLLGRRRLLGLALAAPLVLALGACGDDTETASTPGTSGAEPTAPPVSDTGDVTTVPGTYDHPTGADDVVLRIGYEGGFVPREVAFQRLPTLLVTGDGRVITQGPQIAIFPGPLLPNVLQRTITEAGIQELLALADDHGLFEEADYTGPEGTIADAADTVVEIDVDGRSIVHRAYALGIDTPDGDGERSEARRRLAEFVERASNVQAAVADDQLGAEEPYVADQYRLNAFEAGDASGFDVEPTVLDWPADASVDLSAASQCALVPADELRPLFEDATQLTWFVDDGVTYAVAVAPFLPGDEC